MPEPDDIALLKEYAESHSEAAFAELVARYVNLVYSAALRSVGNAQAAEEITQAVFIILARKAKDLSQHAVLSGWLYQTARLTAANHVRTEIRRQNREQEAFMQTILNEPESEAWRQIAPLLDDAMGRLGEKDRNAIVLRFFENKNLREVGLALGASEDAAKMRVNRALEKLRKIFSKRGVNSTTAAIAGAVSANSVQAAPMTLAKTISAVAVAKGAAASSSTLTLVKGALKIMAWTKVKTAVVVGVVAILAATSTVVIGIKVAQAHRNRPALMGVVADIQEDGTIFARVNFEIINLSGKTLAARHTEMINIGLNIQRFTDETGQNIKYTKNILKDGQFSYVYAFNKDVPPGGRFTLAMEGTIDGVGSGSIKPAGEPGVFELQTHEQMGFPFIVRRSDLYRLPPGAVLLEKSPADWIATTNNGRVELRIDKMLPPPGKFESLIRYRLATTTN
jgi:RNA polymerase sigma factor (sigma-70 family)